MTEKKKLIALDMDDTIVYLMKAMMEDHNAKYPDCLLTYDQVIAFDETMFHPEYNKYDYFKTPGVFFDLQPVDEFVLDEIKKLHEAYDLIIVTSAFAESVHDKWRWIQTYLPFIPHENFCTFSRKDLIQADILIDDAIHNVKPWVAKGRPAFVLSHHWNQELRDLEGVHMFNSWHGLKEKIDAVLLEEEL